MFGNAAVFGWPPAELRRATLGEYRAALAGWNRAQGGSEPLTRGELERIRRTVARAGARERARHGG